MKTRSLVGLILLWLFAPNGQLFSQWSAYASMPTARWGMGCVSEGGKLYAISGNAVTNNEVYTPGANTWAILAPIPIPTAYPQVAAWGGKIYVMGGTNGGAWLTNNQIYDVATNTWSVGAALPSGRMGGTAVAFGNRIYLATGWNGALMNSVHIYDIVSNTWSVGASSSTARYQTRGGLINGRMYVAGGYTTTWIGLTEAYDILSNTWSTVAAMPVARYIHAGGTDGTELFMAAGYNGAASNSFNSFNPVSNTWTVRPNAPTARYRVDGAVVNGCFYVAGGFNGTTLATLEGFCGLAVLPSNQVHLTAKANDHSVDLHWDFFSRNDVYDLEIQRSSDGVVFNVISSEIEASATSMIDVAPNGDWFAYRLQWKDENGEIQFSNTAVVSMAAAGTGDFQYFAASSTLQFVPEAPFPLAQGTASLHDLQGKTLREEKVSGPFQWELANYPHGVYIFRYACPTGILQRKLLR